MRAEHIEALERVKIQYPVVLTSGLTARDLCCMSQLSMAPHFLSLLNVCKRPDEDVCLTLCYVTHPGSHHMQKMFVFFLIDLSYRPYLCMRISRNTVKYSQFVCLSNFYYVVCQQTQKETKEETRLRLMTRSETMMMMISVKNYFKQLKY